MSSRATTRSAGRESSLLRPRKLLAEKLRRPSNDIVARSGVGGNAFASAAGIVEVVGGAPVELGLNVAVGVIEQLTTLFRRDLFIGRAHEQAQRRVSAVVGLGEMTLQSAGRIEGERSAKSRGGRMV